MSRIQGGYEANYGNPKARAKHMKQDVGVTQNFESV